MLQKRIQIGLLDVNFIREKTQLDSTMPSSYLNLFSIQWLSLVATEVARNEFSSIERTRLAGSKLEEQPAADERTNDCTNGARRRNYFILFYSILFYLVYHLISGNKDEMKIGQILVEFSSPFKACLTRLTLIVD